jgi:hypothetical protein
MKISAEAHTQLVQVIASMHKDRLPWMNYWREIASWYLPKRYVWLQSAQERTRYLTVNANILDATGTDAGRILAAGMMNGITSPSRPWFKLRIAGRADSSNSAIRVWLDEVERRMRLVMAESNFYNALAVMYLDLAFFGTASMLIYESFEDVITCYNCALGEYYLGQSAEQRVNRFARRFTYKIDQIVEAWGAENLSPTTKAIYDTKGAARQTDIELFHMIEPNLKDELFIPGGFAFREIYWEASQTDGQILGKRGFFELPGVWPRWEVTSNDAYGTSPGLDALGDVMQLQIETKRKGQALDYLVRPHMLVDISLQHKPTAFLPGGQTFVAGIRDGNTGVRAAWEVRPPLQELTQDIRDIQARIRMIFQNDLFQMISQLETVRSATEIDARREEKLIRLGPVLERFGHEALDKAIERIYGIMSRAKLLPNAPPGFEDNDIEIQYVSILSSAQSAVGVIPTERFLELVGNVSAAVPDVLMIPNFEELLRDYAYAIGVPEKGLNSKEQIAAMQAERQQQQEAQQIAEAVPVATDAARLLSETDVGGGANALQQIIGG